MIPPLWFLALLLSPALWSLFMEGVWYYCRRPRAQQQTGVLVQNYICKKKPDVTTFLTYRG